MLHGHPLLWRLILSGKVTAGELEQWYTLEDVMDLTALLDMQADHEAEASERAERERTRK